MAASASATAGELLRIEPLELRFPFELKKQISCSMQLSNLSDDYIAFKRLSFDFVFPAILCPVNCRRTLVWIDTTLYWTVVLRNGFVDGITGNLFISVVSQLILDNSYHDVKVKTTSPKKYSVRPNTGVVSPRSTCDVLVTMQAQREAPPDMQCKDKFLVQSVVAPAGATVKDITGEMFAKESGNKMEEVKLRVTYVSPPQPPSPVPEESEEGSPSRVSESETGDGTAGGFTKLNTGAWVLQAGALISKLTEEKNSAIQQNHRLRQELDLVRREISKRRGGGFSFVVVIIVALIGILLGYLMKS
ncbi:hypothetical protein PR202_gb28763 [Eleusine coracana subsp. coracana]|uniref:MSP domain-containing protein n=1 Tax=Eleusine coracana subsp. coracana TaxID=191504 RepID=A0AAV5FX89_ELECO|nr:hypothetical protein PR202_gb28763 [Eleusine coracana subsp. coracana]